MELFSQEIPSEMPSVLQPQIWLKSNFQECLSFCAVKFYFGIKQILLVLLTALFLVPASAPRLV